MSNNKAISVEETIVFWSERAKKSLTNEEAKEVIANVSSFFKILREWEQQEIQNLRKRRKDDKK